MKPEELINAVRHEIRKEVRKLHKQRSVVSTRFPLPYTLLVSAGVIATFAGLSRLIDKIDFLNRNPWMLLTAGLLILILTGSVYRKLR